MSEKNHVIKLCSINIAGFSAKSQFMMNKYAFDEKFHIIAMQETESSDKEKLKLCNMNVITDTNQAKNHGASIYTRNDSTCTKIPELSKISEKIDSVWGVAVIDTKRYIVGSVYVKHHYLDGISETITMLNAANNMIKRFNACGVILQGDLNARHTAWGDKKNDAYGNELVKLLDNNLYSIISSSSPTFLCEGGDSKIDLVIISKNLTNKVETCRTDDLVELASGAPLRGHVPVITTIKKHNIPNGQTKVTDKLDIDSIKWALWTEDLEKELEKNEDKANHYEEPVELWKYLEDTINTITSKHCTRKKSTIHSKPYWTKNLTRLCEEMRRTRKIYQKRNTDSNKLNMILAKETFDEARKYECEKFIMEKTKNLNSTESRKFWKEFNKIFKKTSEGKIDPLEDDAGGLITDNAQLEEKMFATFFQCKHMIDGDFDEFFYDRVNQLYDDIKSEIKIDDAVQQKLNSNISLSEIKKAIKKTDANKRSMDNHQMHPKMLHQFGNRAVKLVQKLFNMSLNKGIWPWNNSEVIFLKKDGKKTYSLPGSYRPISISSYIGKLLEKILAARLISYLIQKGYYDPEQEGFTQGRNTIRYLNRLNLQIKLDILESKTVIGLFIDFEKAFDSVWKKGLIVKLDRLGVQGNILRLIDNFLHYRTVNLNINGDTGNTRNCEQYGLPQGSALSPILFKIYVMDILDDMKDNEEIEVYKFADDGTIKIASNTTTSCESRLAEVTQSLGNWTRSWRMVINCDPNKTEFICFNKAEKEDKVSNSIILTGKKVQQVEQTKVLGLIIDSKLSFKDHSKEIHRRLLEKWVRICQYCNIHWGFNQRVLRNIINTNFIPTMQYAGHIYINNKNMNDISQLWYKFIKTAVGAVFNVKINIGEVILGIPPVAIQTDINRIKHFLKLVINRSPHDRYEKFIKSCYLDHVHQPTELKIAMKDTFKFLKWKLALKPAHFTTEDAEIICNQDYYKFTNLSLKSCSYTKDNIKKYIEQLWYEKLKNECLIAGENNIPKPHCQKLPIPLDISRRDEVILMSLMYTQNLMNSFVYRNTYCTESPLCPKCLREEQTPYHVLTVCNKNHELILNLMIELLGEEGVQDDCTTILNCSRSKKFIHFCLEIIKNGKFRDSIVLHQNQLQGLNGPHAIMSS